MKTACALTIAGSDSGGGAGVQADLKTFASLKVHGLTVITALTAQNTKRVEGTFDVPTDFIAKQLDAVASDFEIKWAKTGMISSKEIIREVVIGIEKHEIKLVMDPVMVASSGDALIKEDAVEELKTLIKIAEIVTPNIPEAEKLSGVKINDLESMEKAARAIFELGPKAVLIKGGHMEGDEVVDLLLSNGEIKIFKGPRVTGGSVHGTGCTFAAAITAELAKGANL